MGGTNIRAGIVVDGSIQTLKSEPLQTKENVLNQLFGFIDAMINKEVAAIGVAVPGWVDAQSRVLHNVVNIPTWQEIDLEKILEARYQLPVKIENDANCFALGELYFGGAKNYNFVIGLTIGTGLGSGIIIDKKLVSGKHGGAGEFGMMKYLDKNIEYYVSGKFFENIYKLNGETVYAQALQGNKDALKMYEIFGQHLGEAIKMILYALDVECFIIGGGVKNAFPFFSKAMWETLSSFEYKRALQHLKIEPSQLINSNILGAAALHSLNFGIFKTR
ncbi:MAG: ROK family protein [Chitinophagaceae bacterium]|nr:ROK family protein [Chitinophagaceae bacterium]